MADNEFDADEFLSEIGVEENDGNSHVVKLLRKQLKDLGKQLKDARTTIDSFETEKVKASMADTWKTLGVPEVLREDYHGEQKPEAITAWWEARKGFYNISPEQTTDVTPEAAQQAQDLQAVNQASNAGQDQVNGLSTDAFKAKAAELARTRPSNNPHALADLLNSFGMRSGIDVPKV